MPVESCLKVTGYGFTGYTQRHKIAFEKSVETALNGINEKNRGHFEPLLIISLT